MSQRKIHLFPMLVVLWAGILSGSTLAAEFEQLRAINCKLVYRVRNGANENFVTVVETMTDCRMNDDELYQFVSDSGDKKTVTLLRAKDLQPVSIASFDGNGRKQWSIEYQNDVVSFYFPADDYCKTLKLGGEYYDQNTLAYVFRAFPFGKGARVRFKIVLSGRRGGPAGVFGMCVREAGRTKIAVPAGTFDCYKLEMGVAGLAGIFAAKCKYYFYFTVDQPHFLVKYEDVDRRLTELIGKG